MLRPNNLIAGRKDWNWVKKEIGANFEEMEE